MRHTIFGSPFNILIIIFMSAIPLTRIVLRDNRVINGRSAAGAVVRSYLLCFYTDPKYLILLSMGRVTIISVTKTN